MRKRKKLVKKRFLAFAMALIMAVPAHLPFSGGQKEAVMAADKSAMTRLTDEQVQQLQIQRSEYSRVAVHDPSIADLSEAGGTGYYIFGSHMGVAKTSDLKNWTNSPINGEFVAAGATPYYGKRVGNTVQSVPYTEAFTSNEVTGPTTLHKKDGTEYTVNFGTYNLNNWISPNTIKGNMWAPDIIYNTSMKKWCLYTSLNGPNHNSVIVLLTADQIEGPYVYQAPIIFSGFHSFNESTDPGTGAKTHTYKDTDLELVIGEQATLPRKYDMTQAGENKWGDVWPHMIDPCVSYDDEGNLWLIYGSWSGGIYAIELDEQTGLRDYSVSYENQYPNNYDPFTTGSGSVTSDAYFGTKIAGGCYVSGEGPYVEKFGDYYYLFMSYGFYSPTGGYNMRIFRSEHIDGPYVDCSGKSAIYSTWMDNYHSTGKGLQLMGNYQWNTMSVAEAAQGHNSAYADKDGNNYVIYHTKFADGTVGHQVRVHQLYMNEDGWIVAAPYEYAGETVNDATIRTTSVSKDKIVGGYDLIVHQYNNPRANEPGTVENNMDIVKPVRISLNEDGTIAGAYSGTWSERNGTAYATITLEGKTYKGVFAEQKIDSMNVRTLCFTAVCEETGECIWGSRDPADNIVVARYAAYGVPNETLNSLDLDDGEGFLWEPDIQWTSSNENVIDSDGVVYQPDEDTNVTLTRTVTKGNCYYEKEYPLLIRGKNTSDKKKALSYAGLSEGDKIDKISCLNERTGVSLSFNLTITGNDWTKVFKTDSQEYVYLSILNYGGENIFPQAAAVLSSEATAEGYNQAGAWEIFLHAPVQAKISYNVDGSITFYKNGKLMLTYDKNTAIGTNKVSDLSAAMLRAAQNGEIQVMHPMTNVTIGAAEDGEDISYVAPFAGVSAETQGTAYVDEDSPVTVKFKTMDSFNGQEIIKIDDQAVSVGNTYGNCQVLDVQRSNHTITVLLTVNAWDGSQTKLGETAVSLFSAGGTKQAQTGIGYSLTSPGGRQYHPIRTNGNARAKAYYKIIGTKMYFLSLIRTDKIHSNGVKAGSTTYAWYNGMNSELYMTIGSAKYTVGSHIDGGTLLKSTVNRAGYGADLINGSSVVRNFISYGTFDNDSDTDKGCIMLNVVDLKDVGMTTDTMKGKTFSMDGYVGPNDESGAFVAVYAGQIYAMTQDAEPPVFTGVEDGGAYCGSVTFTVHDDDLTDVKIDGQKKGIQSSYTIAGDGQTHRIIAEDATGNIVECTIIVNDGHTWMAEYTVDRAPTLTQKGIKSIHCSVCDAIKEGSAVEFSDEGAGGEEEGVGTVTATIEGDAYLDAPSPVKVVFKAGGRFTGSEKISVNGTTLAKGGVKDKCTVSDIVRGTKEIDVFLRIDPPAGWHNELIGSYEVSLLDSETNDPLAKKAIEYRLDQISDAGLYQPIKTADNAFSKAYYKIDGTKISFLTIVQREKIHSDGVTAAGKAYEWYNGICSQIYMTLDGKKYSVGSHLYEGKYANPIMWDGDDYTLIKDNGTAVRGYLAYGTFDDDSDTDRGCVLLNVVDLSSIGLTAATMTGKTFTLSGYIGPNDAGINGDGRAFAEVDAAKTYELKKSTMKPQISGIENGKTYCGSIAFSVVDDDLSDVTIDGQSQGSLQSYSIAGDGQSHVVVVTDESGNEVRCTVTVNAGHTPVADKGEASTCEKKGKTDGSHCGVCGKILVEQTETALADHIWNTDYTIDQAATATTPGSKSIHCSVCGTIREGSSVEIPATGGGSGGGNEGGGSGGNEGGGSGGNEGGGSGGSGGSGGNEGGGSGGNEGGGSGGNEGGGSGGNEGGGSGSGNGGGSAALKENKVTLSKITYKFTASAKKKVFSLNAKAAGGVITYQSNHRNITVDGKGNVTIKANASGVAVITLQAGGNGYKTVAYTVRVTVNPAKHKNVKAGSKQRKKLCVQWKKNPMISGTEVQYSTKKNFSKLTTKTKTVKASAKKVTLKNLKGTYYVRVRAFTTVSVDGKIQKLYSGWSAKKKVKIK